MKKKKNFINSADILGLIFLIVLIFLPFIDFKYSNNIKMSSTIFFVAYLSFLFSHMPKFKPFLFTIPILVNTFIIFYIFNRLSFLNNKQIFLDIAFTIRDNFNLISTCIIYYLLERIISKIFGINFTIFLGILLFLLHFLFQYTNIFKNYVVCEPYLVNFSIFLIFSKISHKKKLPPIIYLISLLLICLEIFIIIKKEIYIGFLVTPLLFLALIFLKKKKFSKDNFEKKFIFAIIFIFPIINYLLYNFITLKIFALNLSSLIITFFISVILHEAKIKILNYIFLGF